MRTRILPGDKRVVKFGKKGKKRHLRPIVWPKGKVITADRHFGRGGNSAEFCDGKNGKICNLKEEKGISENAPRGKKKRNLLAVRGGNFRRQKREEGKV